MDFLKKYIVIFFFMRLVCCPGVGTLYWLMGPVCCDSICMHWVFPSELPLGVPLVRGVDSERARPSSSDKLGLSC